MTQRDVQDHWNSLVNQLGAEPQPGPPPAAKKPTDESSRRVPAATRVRPPSADWAELAVQLGVVGPEPMAEARKWRLRETSEPAPRRETAQEEPAEKREAGGFAAGLRAEAATRAEEPGPTAEEAAAEAAPWLAEIESEDAPQERRRRRKRRRSRGERGE